jgi:hypothetical protein
LLLLIIVAMNHDFLIAENLSSWIFAFSLLEHETWRSWTVFPKQRKDSTKTKFLASCHPFIHPAAPKRVRLVLDHKRAEGEVASGNG